MDCVSVAVRTSTTPAWLPTIFDRKGVRHARSGHCWTPLHNVAAVDHNVAVVTMSQITARNERAADSN